MPYTIESTILYKNLIKYRDILKFVIEMRSYTFLATTTAGLSNEKINVTSLRDFYSNDENDIDAIISHLLFLLESAFPNYVALFKEPLETAKKNAPNGAIELKPKDENPI